MIYRHILHIFKKKNRFYTTPGAKQMWNPNCGRQIGVAECHMDGVDECHMDGGAECHIDGCTLQRTANGVSAAELHDTGVRIVFTTANRHTC